jgi:S1-C subfamily serine protease
LNDRFDSVFLAAAIACQIVCGLSGSSTDRHGTGRPDRATDQRTTDVHPSFLGLAVRICNQKDAQIRWGSGTIIENTGERAYVLTVKHLIEDKAGHDQWGRVTVHKVDGETFPASLVHMSAVEDLCLLSIPAPSDPEGVDLAPTLAQRGELIGFEADGKIHKHVGTVLGRHGRAASYRFHIEHGDSGGGMFDPQGRLAGIGTHYFRDEAGQPSRIVIVDAIREFLAEPACFQLLRRLRGQILQQRLSTIDNSTASTQKM